MRIVYVVPFQPYPPNDGGSIRIWHTLRALSQRNEVDLVVQDQEPPETDVAMVRPLVRSLTFVPRRARSPFMPRHGRTAAVVDTLSYPPAYAQAFRSPRLENVLAAMLTEGRQVDWLLCDTQLSGQVALSHRLPPVRRALCLYDLYGPWYRRKLAATPPGPYSVKFAIDWVKAHHFEGRIMRRYDLISVVSQDDHHLVTNRVPGIPVVLVPNGVDTDFFRPNGYREAAWNETHEAALMPASHIVSDIIFVANFSYEPNVDAARYFLEDIWPLVRPYRPGARLLLVGKDPPEWLRDVPKHDPAVVVTGTVADVRPWYRRARAAVVPMRLGAGTKLKVLEALAMGVPVISTPNGCAGIAGLDSRHILVGASSRQFAEQLVDILHNDYLTERLAIAGRELTVGQYNWATIMARFEDTLRDCVIHRR